MFNPTLKRRETILFFLIVVINELIWIDSNIGLDMCEGGWREEVSKIEISILNLLKESECCVLVQIVLCIFFFLFQINNIQKYYSISFCVISIIIMFAPTSINYVSLYSVVYFFFLFKLIIFRSIIQLLFVLFPLLLCLHQQVLIMLV